MAFHKLGDNSGKVSGDITDMKGKKPETKAEPKKEEKTPAKVGK